MEESMHIVENRVASFIDAKFPWPHPDTFGVVPLNLAEAGFYFDPQYSDDDSCVCFLCQKSLGGWEEEDNPFSEHISHAPYCAWAKLLCSRLYVTGSPIPLDNYNEDDYLPTSSFMEAARAVTFQEFWPHENKKGWLCNIKKMAKAGFHYNPTLDSDDTACCIYCNTALDGWEPRDSPVKEHRKRAPTCPFFTKDLKAILKKRATVSDKEMSADNIVETDGTKPEDPLIGGLSNLVSHTSSSSEKSQPQMRTKNQRGAKKKKEVKLHPEALEFPGVETQKKEELQPTVPERKVRGTRKRKVDAEIKQAASVVSKVSYEEGDLMNVDTKQTEDTQYNESELEQESKPKSKRTRKHDNKDINIQEESAQNNVTSISELKEPSTSQTSADEKPESVQVSENPGAVLQSDSDENPTAISVDDNSKNSLRQDSEKITSSNSAPEDEQEVQKEEEFLICGVLSEEEQNMSVEQFMRSLIDKQVKKLQSESERKIAQFMQEADNIKKMITAMDS